MLREYRWFHFFARGTACNYSRGRLGDLRAQRGRRRGREGNQGRETDLQKREFMNSDPGCLYFNNRPARLSCRFSSSEWCRDTVHLLLSTPPPLFFTSSTPPSIFFTSSTSILHLLHSPLFSSSSVIHFLPSPLYSSLLCYLPPLLYTSFFPNSIRLQLHSLLLSSSLSSIC